MEFEPPDIIPTQSITFARNITTNVDQYLGVNGGVATVGGNTVGIVGVVAVPSWLYAVTWQTGKSTQFVFEVNGEDKRTLFLNQRDSRVWYGEVDRRIIKLKPGDEIRIQFRRLLEAPGVSVLTVHLAEDY